MRQLMRPNEVAEWEVQEEGLILQTTDGQQFVLLSLEEWHGFEVGESDDLEQEVKATSDNKALFTRQELMMGTFKVYHSQSNNLPYSISLPTTEYFRL